MPPPACRSAGFAPPSYCHRYPAHRPRRKRRTLYHGRQTPSPASRADRPEQTASRLIFAIVSTTNIPNSLPQIFEGASVQNYQGGHFWTPITPIMGSTLHAYPQVEAINGLYKAEVIHRLGPWKNMESVEWQTLKWVDWLQQSAPVGTHWKHPASRSRREVLCTESRLRYGRMKRSK